MPCLPCAIPFIALGFAGVGGAEAVKRRYWLVAISAIIVITSIILWIYLRNKCKKNGKCGMKPTTEAFHRRSRASQHTPDVKPFNLCGERIDYPHFGELGDVAPPGVPIIPSPCQDYYKSKGDYGKAGPVCRECIFDAYNAERTCTCPYPSSGDKEDWLVFQRCVQVSKENCPNTYLAVTNSGSFTK